MFGKKIHLFSIFGFKVGIDITWFILAILIIWSLAQGLFPHFYEGLSEATYWWMGVAGALGLFGSIVFHEFCHSIVARHYGLPMKGITLFIFGGIAEMEDQPENPKTELLMAIAGPVSSIILGFILLGAYLLANKGNWPVSVKGIFQYLYWINFVLAGFNLIPAFPLDGGRVLRSSLWWIKGNLKWATKIATNMGSGMGIILIVLGIFVFISGNFIGGIWYFLIGMFIKGASQMSYRQVIIRRVLAGEEIRHFMNENPVTVSSSQTIRDLVEHYIYKYHYKMFPVVDDGHLKGCVTSQEVKNIEKHNWDDITVERILQPCSENNTINPHTDAMSVLSIMNKSGNSRLMVVEGDRLEGIVTLKDMLKFLSLKIDLEEGEEINLPQTK